MSEETSWRQEKFLISLLASLNHDIDSRVSCFVFAADAGGGVARNRRRLAAGRDALRDISWCLDIILPNAAESVSRHLIPLKEAVDARLRTVIAPGFS